MAATETSCPPARGLPPWRQINHPDGAVGLAEALGRTVGLARLSHGGERGLFEAGLSPETGSVGAFLTRSPGSPRCSTRSCPR